MADKKKSTAEIPADELSLAERATDVRDAVDSIRRAVAGVQSKRAVELVDLAEQLDRHFNELHQIGMQAWAPELAAER
ncbi:hypothetical protein [Mycobacteroides abscessus]|uniref:hypothetical protein n=1 Tax=Mycobacteroides abscessus TaxID=36809 RepID=UPI000C25B0A6|nr:hypothetical protein [Mycobacteroides abscessus]